MTILNDKEIRSLCLIPTHLCKDMSPVYPLAFFNEEWYDVRSGSRYKSADDLVELLKPEPSSDHPDYKNRMIAPFVPHQVRYEGERKVISYGTSSMGYDVRLGSKFKIFTNINSVIIDPLDVSDDIYVDHEGDYVIIPPNSYVLGHTVEYFNMPMDVMGVCFGKSTYARLGCAINVTPIEPGFRGQVVIEIANQTPLPMKVYAGMGIAQFIFLKGNPCELSYAMREGKYQGQTGIQTALI